MIVDIVSRLMQMIEHLYFTCRSRSIPFVKTFSSVSRSSVKFKVKYLGHIFQEMAIISALVFHKHSL